MGQKTELRQAASFTTFCICCEYFARYIIKIQQTRINTCAVDVVVFEADVVVVE